MSNFYDKPISTYNLFSSLSCPNFVFIECSEPEYFHERLSKIGFELAFLLYAIYSEIIIQGRYDTTRYDDECDLRS